MKARVLGTLPPPYRLKMGGSENTPEGGWLTEFRIIGFKDGRFLIEGATPPGKEYEDEKKYPRNAPKPYAGRGWVAANKVGASYANGGTRMGGLFQAPFTDAKWTPAQRKLGGPLDTDGGPKRILACSGYWGLVESEDGVRGWWRGLCSNQVTNCSQSPRHRAADRRSPCSLTAIRRKNTIGRSGRLLELSSHFARRGPTCWQLSFRNTPLRSASSRPSTSRA